MKQKLVPGANAPLNDDHPTVRAYFDNAGVVTAAIAVIPTGDPGTRPWLPLQDEAPSYVAQVRSPVDFDLALSSLPPEVTTVLLALYVSVSATTLKPLQNVRVEIGDAEIPVAPSDQMVSCLVVAELYRRGTGWKARAKRDGVFDGIEELGRRLSIPIRDERRDERPAAGSPSAGAGQEQSRNWGGSGSLIADRYLVTNAHVVEGAGDIRVRGFSGATAAEPVLVDDRNDLALLRLAESFGPSPLAFRSSGVVLGEKAVAFGYPLQGLLGSGPQVTDGAVSNMLGPRDDLRLMQISCPIQPGSSGGPVFDAGGLIIGVVTGSLSDAQNVNFAIRTGLVLTLLEVAGLAVPLSERTETLDNAEIARRNARFVQRVECRG